MFRACNLPSLSPCLTGPVDYLFASRQKGPRLKSPGGYLFKTGILLLTLSRYNLVSSVIFAFTAAFIEELTSSLSTRFKLFCLICLELPPLGPPLSAHTAGLLLLIALGTASVGHSFVGRHQVGLLTPWKAAKKYPTLQRGPVISRFVCVLYFNKY